MSAPQRFTSPLPGIGFSIMGFTFWVLTDAFMKLGAEAQLPPYEIVGIMGLCSVIVLALKTAPKASLKTLWPQSVKGQLLLSFLSLGSNYSNIIALKHLPLTLVCVVFFTAPMMIALIARLFLKEPLGLVKFAAIVLGFVGVVIALAPFGQDLSNGDLIGYGAAFGSSACFATYMTLTRFLTKSESTESLLFFNGLTQALCAGAIGLFVESGASLTASLFLILLTSGLLNIAGNLFVTLGVKYAPAATVAPFHYTRIITGALVAYLIWHEVPAPHFWVGVALIVATGIVIARNAHRKNAKHELATALSS